MKIILDVERDSDNSYTDQIKFAIRESINSDQVIIILNKPDRELVLSKAELIRALKVLTT